MTEDMKKTMVTCLKEIARKLERYTKANELDIPHIRIYDDLSWAIREGEESMDIDEDKYPSTAEGLVEWLCNQ